MTKAKRAETTTTPRRLADEAEQDTGGALRRARAVWGEHLHGHQWDHLATLSYKRAVSPAQAVRDFKDGFVRRAAFEAGRPLAWFYALERDRAGERIHIHALIAGTADLRTDQLQRAWKGGNTRIVRYDASRAAAWYVVKSLADGADDYDVSRRRPPLLGGANRDSDNSGVSQLISQYRAG